MFDLIMIWVVSTWFIGFVLGFYLAIEEYPLVIRTMMSSSTFNLLMAQTYCRAASHLLHLTGQQFSATGVHSPKTARLICKMIPACCPFERDIQILGRTLFHIPAFCKLNPFYDQLMELRFQALSYLANECGEDVTAYC